MMQYCDKHSILQDVLKLLFWSIYCGLGTLGRLGFPQPYLSLTINSQSWKPLKPIIIIFLGTQREFVRGEFNSKFHRKRDDFSMYVEAAVRSGHSLGKKDAPTGGDATAKTGKKK